MDSNDHKIISSSKNLVKASHSDIYAEEEAIINIQKTLSPQS